MASKHKIHRYNYEMRGSHLTLEHDYIDSVFNINHETKVWGKQDYINHFENLPNRKEEHIVASGKVFKPETGLFLTGVIKSLLSNMYQLNYTTETSNFLPLNAIYIGSFEHKKYYMNLLCYGEDKILTIVINLQGKHKITIEISEDYVFTVNVLKYDRYISSATGSSIELCFGSICTCSYDEFNKLYKKEIEGFHKRQRDKMEKDERIQRKWKYQLFLKGLYECMCGSKNYYCCKCVSH